MALFLLFLFYYSIKLDWRGNAIDFSNNIYSSIGRVFGTIVGGAFFGLIAASVTNLFLKTNTHID